MAASTHRFSADVRHRLRARGAGFPARERPSSAGRLGHISYGRRQRPVKSTARRRAQPGYGQEILSETNKSQVRVLIVEQNAADAELMVSELRRSGMQVAVERVESADHLPSAVRDFEPDVVLV